MANQKIAVVTGASRGLGLALVGELAQNDWHVIGTGRSERPTDLPAGIDYHQFDASDTTACETLWQQVNGQYPDAEVCLVNNAGAYISGGLTDTTPEDYMQQMQSCYFSAVYMTRGLALVIPKARIINIISASALAAHKNNAAYGAAKAAEMHFFQSLQREYKASQYQITNLYPDNVASDGPNPAAMDPADLAQLVREQADNNRSYYLRDIMVYAKTN